MPLPDSVQQQLANYPPLVAAFLEANADDPTKEVLDTAEEWKESISNPDTVCQTRFGLAQTSVIDQILGRVNGDENMTAMRDQLADGVIQEDDSFLMSETEIQDFARGVVRVKSRWQVKLETYASMDQGVLHTTLRGDWSSPYVPLFQAQVTINDSDADDPSKFLATGVLGPDTGVVRLQASFNKDTGVLTLVCKDAPGTSIVTTFGQDDDSKAFCDMLKRGKIVDRKGRITALVAQKKLHPKILTSTVSDEDKEKVANHVLLTDLAKQKALSLGDEIKQLTSSDELLDQHYEQLKLKEVLDTLKAAGVAPPAGAADSVRDLDQLTVADMVATIKANQQANPLQAGGYRALLLSRLGHIDNDHFNTQVPDRDKESFLDERQREMLSSKLSRYMRDQKHQRHQDVNRWRQLNHDIRNLTHLFENRPESDPTPPVEDADDMNLHDVAKKARTELNNRVLEHVEDAELPPDAPVQESGSDSDSDDNEDLDAILKADPLKVPLLLRERNDAASDDDSMIDAVNPKKALQQQLLVKTETKARRTIQNHGGDDKEKKKRGSKQKRVGKQRHE
jgi:hypothetical protein